MVAENNSAPSFGKQELESARSRADRVHDVILTLRRMIEAAEAEAAHAKVISLCLLLEQLEEERARVEVELAKVDARLLSESEKHP
jgi:phage-related minor tail protein